MIFITLFKSKNRFKLKKNGLLRKSRIQLFLILKFVNKIYFEKL